MTKLVRLTMTAGAFDMLAQVMENHQHTRAERPLVDSIWTSMDGRDEFEIDEKSPGHASADGLGPMRPLSDLSGFEGALPDKERIAFGEDDEDDEDG